MVLTDTRISKELENQVKIEVGENVYFSSFTSQARGVVIIVKKSIPVLFLDSFADTAGNQCAILLEVEGKRILIEGIYGPNIDSPSFYKEELFKRITDWNPSFTIYVGDWNIALDPNLDTLGYNAVNNPRARQELLKKMDELNLIDAYRNLNPTARRYTWKKWGDHKFARLDYFIISNNLLPFINKADILPKCFSDHNPILLDIDFSKFHRGRGFWKMNNSLLSDPSYVSMVKSTIKRTTCQYAKINGREHFYESSTEEELEAFLNSQTPESLQSLPLSTNSETFLETLLMAIRRDTILYSAEKKRLRLEEEQKLLKDIDILEKEISKRDVIITSLDNELSVKKLSLENIYAYQAQGAYVRSRAAYKLEGEKPTKFFCALEKQNGVQKYVPQLIVKDSDNQEVLICDQKNVEEEITMFYEHLYKNKDQELEIYSIEQFLGTPQAPVNRISDDERTTMAGPITVQELTAYLKKSKNNVSPGSSGFTNEFYKFFWRDLKFFVSNSIQYAFEHKRLSITQNLGIISIIPKGDKDKRYLNNWRPITLLNSLYKIVSGCIAERIKPVLDKIIHPDQKGFVQGRYIGETIRTTYDVLKYAKDQKLVGILLCVDFEKAYDSISFKYIRKVLEFFDFGASLIQWVEILLHDFSALVNHCGNLSRTFSISRGCRQGDPIASYLFILCIEILAIKLRSDCTVEGFTVGNRRHLLEIYADDLSVFLSPQEANLRRVIMILQDFHKLSGLKISVTKSTAIWFGTAWDSSIRLCEDLGLSWAKTFKLLGITFDSNLDSMESNFDANIVKIEKLLKHWTYRYLTPFGKITIIKSLALSKLSHIALVIPSPNPGMINRINTILYNFLWNNKSEKVNREESQLPAKMGGLGMPNISKFWSSFKISWFRRLLTTESFWPHILETQVSEILNKNINRFEILELGAVKLSTLAKKITNTFWSQVLKTAAELNSQASISFPEKIMSFPFFNNPSVLRANKPVLEEHFPQLRGNVRVLADFFYPATCEIMTQADFHNKYKCIVSLESFIELRYIISLSMQKLKIDKNKIIPAQYPVLPFLIDIALLAKKGCSKYYHILCQKQRINNSLIRRESKWHAELNAALSIEYWTKSRQLCAEIQFDNRVRWLQFQIIRNLLPTNVIVSHFKNVTRFCDYCGLEEELLIHLFWSCNVVKQFIENVKIFLSQVSYEFKPTKLAFLFGQHDLDSQHPKSYLILQLKKYIWATKFKSRQLIVPEFVKLFKKIAVDMVHILLIKENTELYVLWKCISDKLNQI